MEHEELEQHQEQLFPNKMEINLDVFSPLMLDWVGGHVDGADVVAVDDASGVERVM